MWFSVAPLSCWFCIDGFRLRKYLRNSDHSPIVPVWLLSYLLLTCQCLLLPLILWYPQRHLRQIALTKSPDWYPLILRRYCGIITLLIIMIALSLQYWCLRRWWWRELQRSEDTRRWGAVLSEQLACLPSVTGSPPLMKMSMWLSITLSAQHRVA